MTRKDVISERLPADLLSPWQITGARPISGGSIAHSWRVDTTDGPIFVKSHDDPPPRFFEREARGLRTLRAAQAVPVPEVLADSERGLVQEWLTPDGGGIEAPTHESQFGRDLAALHRHTGAAFGSLDDVDIGYLGSVPLDLRPCATWSQSYLQLRVRPLAARAVSERGMDPAALSHVDELISTPQVCGPPEPPTLVHGDLWSGNRVIDGQGRSWLVDPSAHYGHRESDLAMMRLFGGFGAACFAAYQEGFPLAPGWEGRVALHQLAPLFVHVIMFGQGYARAAMRALRSLICSTRG